MISESDPACGSTVRVAEQHFFSSQFPSDGNPSMLRGVAEERALATVVARLQITELSPQVVRPHLSELGFSAVDGQWLRTRLQGILHTRLKQMFPHADPGVIDSVLEMGEPLGKAVSHLSNLYPCRPSWQLSESSILDPDLLALLVQHLSLSDVQVQLVCTSWRDAVGEWRRARLEQTFEVTGICTGAAPALLGGLLLSGRYGVKHLVHRDSGGAPADPASEAGEGPLAERAAAMVTQLGGPQLYSGIACNASSVYAISANRLVALPIVESASEVCSEARDRELKIDCGRQRVASEQPDAAAAADPKAGVRYVRPGGFQLALPAGLACAGESVYVADPYHHRVVVYDAYELCPRRAFGAQLIEGLYVDEWGPSELHSPHAIAVHAAEVFVADQGVAPLSPFREVGYGRVAVFHLDGTLSRSVGPFTRPQGVAVVPAGEHPLSFALLAVAEPHRVHLRRLSGQPFQVVGMGGTEVHWSSAEARLYVVGYLRHWGLTDPLPSCGVEVYALRLWRLAETPSSPEVVRLRV